MLISKCFPVFLLLVTLFLSPALAFYPKGDFSDLTVVGDPGSPRREYQECQQRCQEKVHGERQQEKCQEVCEKQYEKARRSEEHREYEECQERCEERQEGRSQEHQCRQECQKKFEERQKEAESRRPEEDREDPHQKYEECQERCEERPKSRRQQRSCQLECQRKFEEQQKEAERRRSEEEDREDPRQQYEECQERCEKRQASKRQEHECRQECQKKFEEQQKEAESSRSHHDNPHEQGNNPFFFHSRTFQSRFKSKNGFFSVLPTFSQKSSLLRGIENYRFAVWEANPNTFAYPAHCDAQVLIVIVRGRGTITFVNDKRRQSFNVKCGNVIPVPAGTTFYAVNPESNEKLTIIALKEPVNAPGKFDEFFLAGGQKPRSYLNVFSDEVLEAVFNERSDEVRKLFEKEREDPIIRRASGEQLRALSQASSSSSPREKESEFPSPIDLLNLRPRYFNKIGIFHEACPDEFKQLRTMDVAVGALDMKQGTIFVPHYHTKQTTVVFITEGSGQVEMAAPPRAEQSQEDRSEEEEEEKRSGELRKITARLNPGDIFVIPAGFPVTIIASNDNMRGYFFGINAENNKRIFLAGENNVVKNMEKEAQELSFGVSAEQVQKVFGNQKESYFVSERPQRQPRGEKYLSSILDVARLF